MSYVEDDECDYCRGKGWYLMDGVREVCFCTEEPAKPTARKQTKSPAGRPPLRGTTSRHRCVFLATDEEREQIDRAMAERDKAMGDLVREGLAAIGVLGGVRGGTRPQSTAKK